MIAPALGLAGLAALGLLLRRSQRPAPRLCAFAAVLAFAVAATDPVAVGFAAVEPRTAAATLPAADPGKALLAAGAGAGPRSDELTIAWTGPVPGGLPPGPLGARATFAGLPLPLEPQDLQIRLLARATADRPAALQCEAPSLREPATARLLVRGPAGTVLAQPVALEPGRPAEVPFTPAAPGRHEVELELALGPHRVVRTGSFEVTAPPRVLVLEPSGVAAAALAAQGVAVETAAHLPPDWANAAAVVLGGPLPVAEQRLLAEALREGLGLFVLAPGFGAPGEPLRELLPVRPLPPRDVQRGAGQGAAPGEGPAEPKPPVLEPLPAKEPKPPAGDPSEAGPVSKEPIEVDKHAIALVLVVDRSGSMGEEVVSGRTKMSYAKTSALQTCAQLEPGDQVAIVTFGRQGGASVALPLTDVGEPDRVQQGVAALAHNPNEPTHLLSGLQVADQLLQRSAAAVKHVVVITDGEFHDYANLALPALAHQMRTVRQQSVSILSLVAPGSAGEFQKTAEQIAKDGGGIFIAERDPTRIPVFVSAEVTRSLSRVGRQPRGGPGQGPAAEAPPPPAPEPPRRDPEPPPPAPPPPAPEAPQRLRVRAVAESPVLEPAPVPDWPTLGDAAAATAPLDAQVLLVAGEQGWPLLAFGNRGLGRIGVFAADLAGEAGREFRAEPAFAARLSLWVQNVLPAAPARQAEPLLAAVRVEPPAPSPRDLAALAALAGMVPVPAGAAGGPPLGIVRTVASQLPAWALPALLLLVLLAVAERWSLARALRAGQPPG
ncbi:MAG: VWA domain-containing protein [Planctomycetes bacterium]|nr:VWA domain-containing protein [Planctomycetota bacterium]